MKKIFKYLAVALSIVALFAACKKIDTKANLEPLPVYELGKSPVLSSSLVTVAPPLSDSNNAAVKFTWTDPKYANVPNTSRYILEIDSSGKNFANANSKTTIGLTTTSLTGRELNAILLNLNFKLNIAQSIDARVISSYNNNNERYTSNIVKITVTPFADPAKLRSQNTTVSGSLANAAAPSNVFDWEAAFKGYNGAIAYSLQYDSAGKNFVAPFEITFADPAVLTKGMTQGEMNETALASGITAGATGKVEYRIKSVTVGGATTYSNVVNVIINTYIPITRVYLPGGYQASTGNGNDWDPPTAPELIRDQRASVNNKMYYTYIFLPANVEFKITIGRAWDVNYGPASSAASNGTLVAGSGNNFKVTTAGYYRLSFNISTLKYDIRIGRMGFVGGSTPTNWNPPGVFPTNAMANAGKNLFIGVTTFTNGGGWKLIDNDQWDSGSQLVDETRSYGSTAGDGGTLAVNGSNFNDFATAGRYRVIWDGRDPNNVKYNFTPGTEMRVVGDGMNMAGVNDWDPPTSPQMTYAGNGVWTRSVTLKANKDIKFLAGNAWGAFDYEDNSGGSQALGTPRKMQWEGGNNFRTPTVAGTYTITLNENTQTVTIN
jgi:starch-binding outer membrane protein SusE/F